MSIDGGGIKGILPAAILKNFEELLPTGRVVTDYFDYIAGTSTGGIIALGLGAGIPIQEILDIYLKRGNKIFPPRKNNWFRKNIMGSVQPIFDRIILDEVLQEVFGSFNFGSSKIRLCIPAVEGNHGEVHIYKTPHHQDFKTDWQRTTVDVARATSAAPTYFESARQHGFDLVDGGLFANDPIMVAIVDALTCFDIRPRQIKILSLGCLKDAWNLSQVQNHGEGWVSWGLNLYDVVTSLQSQNVQGQASLLIGPENIVRISPPQLKKRIALADWENASQLLPEIAENSALEYQELVFNSFFQKQAELYNPIYK